MKLKFRFWSILPELGARILVVGLLGAAHPAQLQAQPVLDILLRPAPTEEVVLNWSTVSGRRYAVWSTTDLNLPWAELTPAAGSLTAGSNQLALTASRQASQQFFQVAETRSPYDPAWDAAPVQRTIRFTNNPATTTSQNGLRLKNAIQALVPGDSLEIAAGTYSFDSYTALDPQGTAEAPIWIRAVPGATVILTRPDANQNIVNIGAARPARYVCFRGLEFTGGSHGVRLYDCTQVWIDQCRIHDTGDVGLSANARDTSYLFLTRNEIWNTSGTGEGMYLGGNNASVIMSRSVIALNHVHDTIAGVSQGDGIEVKQGSWGNLIAENRVHDCNYPCILVYGTGGQEPNVVEKNLCYRSNDNAMQVQGECVVRNNLVIAAAGSAFASQPHQGGPTSLTVVHNTFVNSGTAVRLSTWGAGTNMVFANNACYSDGGAAINAVNGTGTSTFAGNVCRGTVTSGVPGSVAGTGLTDFVDLAWDASPADARPSPTSRLREAADPAYAVLEDLAGERRTPPHTAGCYH